MINYVANFCQQSKCIACPQQLTWTPVKMSAGGNKKSFASSSPIIRMGDFEKSVDLNNLINSKIRLRIV